MHSCYDETVSVLNSACRATHHVGVRAGRGEQGEEQQHRVREVGGGRGGEVVGAADRGGLPMPWR